MLDVKKINSFHLHLIAFGLMLIDHLRFLQIIGFYNNIEFYKIGRLAFPLFAFMIAEGIRHTRDPKKYLNRLLIAAVFSEISFDSMLAGRLTLEFSSSNVLFTFALAVFFINWIKKSNSVKINKYLHMAIGGLLVLLGILILNPDYQICGVALVCICYWFINSDYRVFIYMVLAFIIFTMSSLGSSLAVSFLGMDLSYQSLACLSFILLFFYNGKRGVTDQHLKRVRLFYYSFYPVHMLLICLISVISGGVY